MPDQNRVVDAARDRAATSLFEGAGALKDATDLVTKVASGDWTEGLVALGSIAFETKDYLRDPLAKLTSMGLGWVIEWFGPLHWIFDQLTGDPEQLNLIVETWSGIAGELAAAADDLHSAHTRDSAGWSGPAVAQYRLYCANQVDLYRAASAAAQSVSDNARVSGAILAAVREVVRGLLTDAAGKAVSVICRFPPPATPAAAPEISSVVVGTGHEIVHWLTRLSRAFANSRDLLGQSGRLFTDVRTMLEISASFGSPALRSGFRSTLTESVGIVARHGVTKALQEMPTGLVEATVVETVKGTVGTAAAVAGDPEPPQAQDLLHDRSWPRVTGTL